MVAESAIPGPANRPAGLENAILVPAKRDLLIERVASVQQNNPKLLQVRLHCSADKTIVDGYRREPASTFKFCTRGTKR